MIVQWSRPYNHNTLIMAPNLVRVRCVHRNKRVRSFYHTYTHTHTHTHATFCVIKKSSWTLHRRRRRVSWHKQRTSLFRPPVPHSCSQCQSSQGSESLLGKVNSTRVILDLDTVQCKTSAAMSQQTYLLIWKSLTKTSKLTKSCHVLNLMKKKTCLVIDQMALLTVCFCCSFYFLLLCLPLLVHFTGTSGHARHFSDRCDVYKVVKVVHRNRSDNHRYRSDNHRYRSDRWLSVLLARAVLGSPCSIPHLKHACTHTHTHTHHALSLFLCCFILLLCFCFFLVGVRVLGGGGWVK